MGGQTSESTGTIHTTFLYPTNLITYSKVPLIVGAKQLISMYKMVSL